MHLFETDASFKESYNGGEYNEPWVSLTKENDEVNYNKTEKEKPLTFNILSNGNIGWKASNSGSTQTIQYSKNGGEWTDLTSTTGGTKISVVAGDVVRFKGDTWPGSTSDNYSQFTSTCSFAAAGNPASLKYGLELTGDEPLADYCYANMFSGCTGLTQAPVLPATTLSNYCYRWMFMNCTSLTTAPELPATTLAQKCYSLMFWGCTSLTSAPALPATTLADYCYQSMFHGCTGLTQAPELPATTMASYCYDGMFQLCTNLATAPALPATTLADWCYYAMFNDCTSLTTAPEFPATTLTTGCYNSMFRGCRNLNYVRCLATDISASNALYNWLANVSSTGTFYKKASVTYPSGASGIPSGWTVTNV